MSFLAMILGLLLLQFWGGDNPVQRDAWFESWRDWLLQRLRSPILLTLTLVLLPPLALHWLLELVDHLLFGLVWIGAAALVLLYSFGRGDYGGDVATYRRYCLEEDWQALYLFTQGQWRTEYNADIPDSPAACEWQARGALLYQGFQRWFPPLLYFLLLGPAGALVYRLAHLNLQHDPDSAHSELLHWLDWLPSRLLALTFAVTGDFVRGWTGLRPSLWSDEPAGALLRRTAGAAALEGGEDRGTVGSGLRAAREITALTELFSRSAALWVVVAALISLLL